jgi:hypothetical protein
VPLNDFTTAQTIDKSHGRIEARTIAVSSLLQGYSDWPYLAQVFRLECHAIETSKGKATHAVRYGVTSLRTEQVNAQRLLVLARQHWRIESGLHYRRDVTLQEARGHVRTGHAPHVHAVLNNTILCFLHQRQAGNLAQSLREVSYRIERHLAALA